MRTVLFFGLFYIGEAIGSPELHKFWQVVMVWVFFLGLLTDVVEFMKKVVEFLVGRLLANEKV